MNTNRLNCSFAVKLSALSNVYWRFSMETWVFTSLLQVLRLWKPSVRGWRCGAETGAHFCSLPTRRRSSWQQKSSQSQVKQCWSLTQLSLDILNKLWSMVYCLKLKGQNWILSLCTVGFPGVYWKSSTLISKAEVRLKTLIDNMSTQVIYTVWWFHLVHPLGCLFVSYLMSHGSNAFGHAVR